MREISNVLNFLDEIGPEKVIHFYNSNAQMKAVLVIDNSVMGVPAGGIRMLPNITLDEMIRLARMMTYKFISYGLPMGGAKSGIWADPNAADRAACINAYAFEISPHIQNNLYHPGPDMGTTAHDVAKILKICHREDLLPQILGETKFGLSIEETYTGYGVLAAVEAVLESKNDKIKGKKIALEGFGKVGSAIALFLKETAAKLVAVSTIQGTIFDEEGLDISKLIDLKSKYGDKLINHYQTQTAEHLPKEKLFQLPVDILIPGARPDVINKQNIDSIQANFIVPAANIPFAPEIIPTLDELNIQVIPDFIANAGEILASAARFRTSNPDEIYATLKHEIRSKAAKIITIAQEQKISIYTAALTQCKKVILRNLKRRTKKRNKLTTNL